ncbi:hypothetical protein [Xanthomonas arboricola]|uniref:hypothetical protein n=1 Tax=Xanthomonas arboricola TaxID=56448 RepID=UPI002B2EAA50|nr:hypothetical protein X12_000168 [Xanthomonas arboricola]
MIAIEFEPPSVSSCECCGKETVRLTRFVTDDGNAHAVYYIQYTPGHEPEHISGLISLGEWGESASPADRIAFPFRLWATEGTYNVGLTDAAESPWSKATFLGAVLDRAQALNHPWCKEVFHITDHITSQDPEAIAFLAGKHQRSA